MVKDWHAMAAQDVLNETGTTREGLKQEDAEARILKYGANQLTQAKRAGIVKKFLLQFKNVMVIVLLCAAAVTAMVAIVEKNYDEFIDVGIILAIVLINAVIGVVQESKAEQALEALKNMSKPFAKVRRGGEIMRIESSKLVPGDIVLLEAGDVVPADLRLIESASLKIEESALTGESLPSEKFAANAVDVSAGIGDRSNMAFSSSIVSYGRGEGVVVATGMNAEMGKIAGMLNEEKDTETPIQRKLNKTGKIISLGVLMIAAVIFIIGILSTIHIGITLDSVLDSFMTAVAIAVAAIPEGLTAVITIIMAIGVQRMSKRNAIIKKLPAVETLGSTEIICSDKTGTLTLNRMTVQKTFTFDTNAEPELMRCMVLCNDTVVKRDGGALSTMGDPTETALVDYCAAAGVAKDAFDQSFPRVNEIPFDSDRKLMSTVHRVENDLIVYTKGAVDMLISKCARVLENGKSRPMTESDRAKIFSQNKELASNALRVLAYATKPAPDSPEEFEKDLTFIGLTGMIDPPREEVKEAVKICKKAGITPVMITGDHRDTAYAIAKELKIAGSEEEVVTGAQLTEMSDEELAANVERYRVYARVSPEHKVRIVKAWKSKGKIVAMTGDGVNDAPSIKAADIGIGMGITGTDVTKGAADMVLADDNFATIVDAVGEGRKIYDNMQKTIQFLLAANIAEVLALFISTVVFAFYPQPVVFLLPIQILWINLVTDSFPALALGMEPSDPDVMNHPPRKSSDNLFAGHLGVNIIYQGILQTAIVIGIFFGCTFGPWGHEVGTTMSFLALSLVQLFHCFNAKSLNGTIFNRNFFRNKMMFAAFGVGIVLTVGVAVIPVFHDIFHLQYLTWQQWLVTIGASLSIIPLVELSKLLIGRIRSRNVKRKTAV